MIDIKLFTKDKIDDVIDFEKALRLEENFYSWSIDDEYKKNVLNSFKLNTFSNSISLLAYIDNKVVGRIDSSIIASHFDGSIKAYLDWICVIKSYRHHGVAQKLMSFLLKELKKKGITTLIGIVASNEESRKFYESLENATISDTGIWIDIK